MTNLATNKLARRRKNVVASMLSGTETVDVPTETVSESTPNATVIIIVRRAIVRHVRRGMIGTGDVHHGWTHDHERMDPKAIARRRASVMATAK